MIKVPHHGSNSSSTEEFIRAVDPQAAVISCKNSRRPSVRLEQTVENYRDRDVEVLRTDTGGAIFMKMYRDRVRLFPRLVEDEERR